MQIEIRMEVPTLIGKMQMNSPKILAIIPARGGSKGIPKKNLYSLAGKPLIQYSIEAAKKSKLISDFIVSTDSDEIKQTAINLGAKVPFMRPQDLSHDTALAIPTIQHSVLTYEKMLNCKFDFIIMLQPTAPLRTAEDIDKSLELLINSDADGIISVVDVENYHPQKMKIIINDQLKDFDETSAENPPRQSLSPIYIVNGAIYATNRDILMNKNTFKGDHCLPFVMPDERSANIDKITDFLIAEYHIKNS